MDRIGRYKIVRELGRGAMGVVYHAIDPNIGRPVAIKTINLAAVLKPDEQERMRERLFREARSAGILSHPGIVTIYDVEQQGDLAYIAMEYVDGPTLDQVLSQPVAMAPDRMFSILAQTAVALDYAHGKGIVHRDVKPANIMINAGGTAKITDFGIAKITASEQFTMTGSIVGTPHYMSPEQVQGQTVDGRSDQFSLAVIAFEMLTGEKPYTGEHLTTVVYKIVAEEPPSPRRINPSLGGAIESVLRKGLNKKPDGRYETCQQFIADLESACNANTGWQSLPRGGSLNVPTVSDQVLTPAASALPPSRRARREDPGASGTTERTPRKRSGFLPFLAAILMAAGLLAVVAFEVKPTWLMNSTGSADKPPAQADATPASPAPSTSSPPPFFDTPAEKKKPAATPPAESPAASAEKAAEKPPEKPSERAASPVVVPGLPPATVAPAKAAPPAEKAPKRTQPARVSPTGQSVTVISSPSGAVATLDGDADSACATPCKLDAMPGSHTLVLNKDGYGLVRLDVPVGSSPVELPAIKMRALQGTLLLSSDPPGAAVLVDGKLYPKVTNTEIQLTPGKHSITVEWKNGKQTRTVEIKEGINHEKFVIEQ